MNYNKVLNTVFCLSVTIIVMKHYDQKHIGDERVYLAYTSKSPFIIEESQDRNHNRVGIWRQELLTGLHPHNLISLFFLLLLLNPELSVQGWYHWQLTRSSSINQWFRKFSTAWTYGHIFFNWDSLLSVNSNLR